VLSNLSGTGATWATFTASYACSAPSDPAANAWLQGSADGGTTWFELTPRQSALPAGSAGARFYTGQPVNALQAFVTCSPGNTVTVTVTGE
jgi:hypothetical protein